MHFGDKLRALRTRAGVSIRAAAADAGMKSASNWQHYESHQFQGSSLPADYTVRLAAAWAGKGDPAISLADILNLTPELASFIAGKGSIYTGTLKHVDDEIIVKIEIQTGTLDAFSRITEALSETLSETHKKFLTK